MRGNRLDAGAGVWVVREAGGEHRSMVLGGRQMGRRQKGAVGWPG